MSTRICEGVGWAFFKTMIPIDYKITNFPYASQSSGSYLLYLKQIYSTGIMQTVAN